MNVSSVIRANIENYMGISCLFDSQYLEKYKYYKWHDYEGVEHRDYDLPAIITPKSRTWYEHGKEHRDHDRPSFIRSDGCKEWMQNGEWHRDHDNPAGIYEDGYMVWRYHDEKRRKINN
jgi:hypothetical protein